MLEQWIPSITMLVVGLSAILALRKEQVRARQTDIWSTFTHIQIIAMGVSKSDWPVEFLISTLQSAQSNLASTEMKPILDTLLETRIH